MLPNSTQNGESLITNTPGTISGNLSVQEIVQVSEGNLTSTNTFLRSFPSNDVRLIRRDNLSATNDLRSLVAENSRDEIRVPSVGGMIHKLMNGLRQREMGDWQIEMVMNSFPNIAPRSGPNTRVTLMNLNNAVTSETVFDLKNRGPKGRFRRSILGQPKGCIREVLGSENRGEKLILLSGNIPSSTHD